MAKVNKKVPQRPGSRHHQGNLRSIRSKITKDSRPKKQKKSSEKKDWQDATCSVCMEFPHNAVLLLCSSYHKGCRPYMCATSYRYSNCLDQYKKAYMKPKPTHGSTHDPDLGPDGFFEKPQEPELLCPLCRGSVKGWTVVERARKFLNSKKRSCMQENCSFVGSYRDLRKHVRADHPWARPREVDPSLAEKWKKLENDRERNDVMSTISATMPGSIVMGDYVIEGSNYLDGVLYRLGSYDGRRNGGGSGGGGFFDNVIFEGDLQWDNDEEDSSDEVGLGGGGGGGGAAARVRNYIPRAGRRRGRALIGGGRRRRMGGGRM